MHRWRVAAVAAAVVVPPAVLAPLAVSSAATAERGHPAPPAAEPAPSPATRTPLLSARRVPGAVTGRLTAAPLREALAPLAGRLGPSACLVVQVGGRPLVAEQATTPLVPASNVKLLTAAVALDRLGPDHRFTTTVVSSAPPVDGRLDGDLVLVGGGDPLLSTAGYLEAAAARLRYAPSPATPLEALADRVVAAGVRTVTGAVVGDDSRYDDERAVPTWPPGYQQDLQVAPIDALVVDDGLASFAPFRPAADPGLRAAEVFAGLLAARGVSVAGGVRRGVAPAGATTVASIQSAPLREVVAELLTHSDNTTAEMLLKELAVANGVQPGTRAAGLAVVTETVTGWGIAPEGLTLVDGSGLDRGNQVSCATLAALLDRFGPGSPLVDGLAVAGRTGTLADRFRGTPVEGVLRAKTGTLRGVRALSGVLPADGARPVVFALVVNGADAEQRAATVTGRLVRALGSYPHRPDLTPYGPLPPG